MIWLLAAVVALYALWCALLFFSQDRLIFPRHFAGPATPGLPNEPYIEQLWLEPGDTVRVEAWLLHPDRSDQSPKPLAVFFHGNAELIEFDLDVAAVYRKLGFHVLLPEYRGYGRSTGRPGQAPITEDALALIDMVAARPDVDADRIIYHGRSIGGGVACAAAARRPPAAMILESTFTSLAAMSRRYLVPSFFLRHPFRNDRVLREYPNPVLLMHGTHDGIVPAIHSRALHILAPNSTLIEIDAGHNNFPPDWHWYESTIRDFLANTNLLD